MSQTIGSKALIFSRTWQHVSARDARLGFLAADIAQRLMGKHQPMYDPSVDAGDYVVVTGARHVVVAGRKSEQKVYRHHTMYPGGLKTVTYKDMMARKPDQIIRKAVSGMLPKNKLRDRRLERLHIYPEDEHPYEANITKRYDLGDAFQETQRGALSAAAAAELARTPK